MKLGRASYAWRGRASCACASLSPQPYLVDVPSYHAYKCIQKLVLSRAFARFLVREKHELHAQKRVLSNAHAVLYARFVGLPVD
eukprot:9221995-Prorocentrum_lima.AAC.1